MQLEINRRIESAAPSQTLTAVILTWNEEENIARTLSHLTWLEKVIIVDSGSTDQTLQLTSNFKNVTVYDRKFNTHANQWNYGLSLCESEWILSLDADYILPDAFTDEVIQNLQVNNISAFLANFEFLVFGKPLRGNNTTPRPVLFKKAACTYYDDGHTQRLQIKGSTAFFKNKIWHDDRKPLGRWLINQSGYSIKEATMLSNTSSTNLSLYARLRKTKILGPVFIFFYCLFIKALILDGWRGWYYTLQRTIAETLIAQRLIEEKQKVKH